MIFPIVRMYSTVQQATEACAKLRAWGIGNNEMNLVTPSTASTDDGIMAAIMSGCVLRADASIYAQGIRRGLSLVSVQAPFGTGRKVAYALDGFSPVDSGVATARDPLPAWDEMYPVSSALHLPLLLDSAAPTSAFVMMPTLISSGKTTCEVFGVPELADSKYAVFGTPKLSNSAAPLSSIFKLPLLV